MKSEARVLVPVMGRDGCIGHLLQTARGWRTCDASDRELGSYPTQQEAVTVLLEASELAA